MAYISLLIPQFMLLTQILQVTGSALQHMHMHMPLPIGRSDSLWPESRAFWPENGVGFPGLHDPRCCMSCTPKPAYICNPDDILDDQSESLQIHNHIQDVIKNAKCACPRNSRECECRNTNPALPQGHYGIGIAVVNGIEGVSSQGSERCRVLASNLIRAWSRDLECCDDGILVVLDVNSSAIYTNTSANAAKALPNDCLAEIFEKIRPILEQRKWYEALDELLKYYANALKGGKCGTRTGLSAGQIAGIVIGVILGVAAIVFLIVLCIGFCRNWDFVVGTCFGICIGCILAQFQRCINALIISAIAALCSMCGCPDCDCQPLDCVGDDGEGGGAGIDF